jgi:hypothetical protein
MAAVAAVLLVAIAPAAMSAPSDGSGNKLVFELEASGVPIFCDEDQIPDLWFDLEGWIQIREFTEESRNVELDVYHLDGTYTNADGDSWVWHDRGPDLGYLDSDGNHIVATVGRTGLNNIGRILVTLDTGEVEFQAGRAPFGGELFEFNTTAFACKTLTPQAQGLLEPS